jgi:hypothetical protein
VKVAVQLMYARVVGAVVAFGDGKGRGKATDVGVGRRALWVS